MWTMIVAAMSIDNTEPCSYAHPISVSVFVS